MNSEIKIIECLKNKKIKIETPLLKIILKVESEHREKVGLVGETSYLYDCKVSQIHKLLEDRNIKVNLSTLANILLIEKELRKSKDKKGGMTYHER